MVSDLGEVLTSAEEFRLIQDWIRLAELDHVTVHLYAGQISISYWQKFRDHFFTVCMVPGIIHWKYIFIPLDVVGAFCMCSESRRIMAHYYILLILKWIVWHEIIFLYVSILVFGKRAVPFFGIFHELLRRCMVLHYGNVCRPMDTGCVSWKVVFLFWWPELFSIIVDKSS